MLGIFTFIAGLRVLLLLVRTVGNGVGGGSRLRRVSEGVLAVI